MNINKIYHQIWFQGESEIPKKYEQYYTSCRKVNKDFKRIIWDSKKIDKLIKNNYSSYYEFYNNLPLMVQKIDYAKYIILYHYGGIYIDMDVLCLKNMKKLLELFSDADFIVSYLPLSKTEIFSVNKLNKIIRRKKAIKVDKMINNGIILCKKNSEIIKIIMDKIKENFYTKYKKMFRDVYIFNTTGPIIFSDIINNYQGKDNVKVIDSKYMEPCTVLMKKCDLTKSFFKHEHQRTWGTNKLEYIISIIKFYNKYKIIIYLIILFLIHKYLF